MCKPALNHSLCAVLLVAVKMPTFGEFSLFIGVILSVLTRVYCETLKYNFLVERNIINIDGVIRDALTVNGQAIGPTIEAIVGDKLHITVTNMCLMQEVISMHWHGINQIGTPWADGAAFVTNCPITFGSSYEYRFTVDSPGTYWYHAHIGSQREEGASGMIIVRTDPSLESNELVLVTKAMLDTLA